MGGFMSKFLDNSIVEPVESEDDDALVTMSELPLISGRCGRLPKIPFYEHSPGLKKKRSIHRSKSSAITAPARKRNKVSTTAVPDEGLRVLQATISTLRRNAQSTTDLVAQLTENLPQHLAAEISANSLSASPDSENKIIPRQPTADSLTSTLDSPPVMLAHPISPSVASPSNAPILKPSSVTGTTNTTSTTPNDSKVDWSSGIPTLAELEKRITVNQTSKTAVCITNQNQVCIVTSGSRKLVCGPFVDDGTCDFLKAPYRTEVSYPRACLSL